ncbi:MAG: hypothetical protein ACYDGY_09135 [Acidimicrobiales bacterium]
MTTLRGKWAEGIEPRNFHWVLMDQVAISERPGGSGASHRKVRREEEIVWLRVNGFTRIISLLQSPHNLAAYEEGGMPYSNIPLHYGSSGAASLKVLYGSMDRLLSAGERVLLHADGVDDRLVGTLGGYLLWSKRLKDNVQVIEVMEKLTKVHLSSDGRQVIALASTLV